MRYVIAAGTLLLLCGCGAQMPKDAMFSDASSGGVNEVEYAAAEAEAVEPPMLDQQRKIIYEADIDVIVDDFSETERRIPELVSSHGGYLSEVSVDRTQGRRLTGRWVARVPVENYKEFLDALSKLGVPEQFNQTAQDVTEEFVDLDARIANKQQLETRILALLEESEGEIKDVIEVERELARVRSEIEQMEGRLRYLKDRTSLTTVTITVTEYEDYVPPQAPTFVARISRTWGSSLVSVRQFGENLVIATVFLAPWLVIGLLFVTPIVWLLRRRRRAPRDGNAQ
jgi:hypothetical protein